MKSSRYNILIEKKQNKCLVYNSLFGSIAYLSHDLYDAMNKRAQKINSPEILKRLKKLGLIVDDNFDELQYYHEMHMSWKTGKEVVNFNILLTYDCNFACPYCYQGRGSKGAKIHNFAYMPNKIFNSTIKFMKATALERQSKKLELVLYGGEPFLVPDKCKFLADTMASWCSDHGVEFQLHALSNGSLINEEIIQWLSKYHCRLQIPVDGAKSTHNQYRYYIGENNRGSYDDIISVLEKVKNTNIKTHLRISLTEETYPSIVELLDDLKSRGLTHVYPDFCYITAFTEACNGFKNVCLSDSKLFKIFPILWMEAHTRGFPLDHVKPTVQPLPCSSIADGSFIIDTFGEVYKCWELVGLKEHCVGKLSENGILNKKDKYNDMLSRDPVTISKCREHCYLPTCGGGCICKSYWKYGTYNAPGCGTDLYLLTDKVKTYIKTIVAPGHKLVDNDFVLEIMEEKQQPSIRHCYVLV